MDQDNDGYLNFKELSTLLGLTCTADMTQRLKTFFIIHLPPLLTSADFESPTKSPCSPSEESAAEVAAEATHFFNDTEITSNSITPTESAISAGDMISPTTPLLAGPSTSVSAQHLTSILYGGNSAAQIGAGEAPIPSSPCWEIKNLSDLRNIVESRESKIDLKSVPKMLQPHFNVMFMTLFDLFFDQSDAVQNGIAEIGKLPLN